MKYKAFISYRHSEFSRPHAEALERSLKRYAKAILRPPLSIFRDERVLRPGGDLPTEIRNGLEQSEFLLYLATAEAARSEWIADELRIWCDELGRREKLIIIHLDGTIEAEPGRRAIVWHRTDALPRLLERHIDGIPIWEDLTWARSPEQRDLFNNDYRKVVNALVARFRNLDPGAMNDEEVLTHRRNILIRNLAMGTIATLGIVAAAFWYVATENATRLARSLSESDFREAEIELRAGRQREAYALLARAIRNDAENRSASDRLIHLLNTRELPVAVKVAEPAATAWTQLHSSPDGRYALAISLEGALRIWTVGGREDWRPSIPAIKAIDAGGDVALAQTIDGRLLRIELDTREVSEITSPVAPVTTFDLADSGTHVALSGGNTLCVGRFAAPITCEFRRDGNWTLGRDALSGSGIDVISTSEGNIHVAGTLSSDIGSASLEDLNERLDGAASAFIGPNDTICRVVIDPGGLQEESWTELTCYEGYYRFILGARFDSAVPLHFDVSDEGGFVLAAVDNDEVHLLSSEGESFHIDLPDLEEARAFANGRAFYTVSAAREVRFFDSGTGRELGLPLQLDRGRRPQIVPFGQGIFALMADGSAYRWQARLLDGANDLRSGDPLPDWYDAPGTSSAGVTLRAGDDVGDWIIARAGAASLTIRHPLPMDEEQAEQMAESIGIWPQTIAALAREAPVILTAAGNDDLIVWDSSTGTETRRITTAGDHLFATSVYVDPSGKSAMVVYANASRTDRYCYGTGVAEYARVDLTRTTAPASSALPVGWTLQDATKDLAEFLTVNGPDLRVVDALTGNSRLAVSADAPVILATIGPQGRVFAAATRSGLVYVWDIETGLPIADRLVFDPDPQGHNGAPCDDDYSWNQGPLVFSPDGQILGLRATHVTSAGSEQTTVPLSWSIGHRLNARGADALERIVEAVAGARLDEDGSLERLPQPDLGTIQEALANQETILRNNLPIWLSKNE